MNLFIIKSDRLKKEINIKVKFITFYKFYVTARETRKKNQDEVMQGNAL